MKGSILKVLGTTTEPARIVIDKMTVYNMAGVLLHLEGHRGWKPSIISEHYRLERPDFGWARW
jgi:hypothetical protein